MTSMEAPPSPLIAQLTGAELKPGALWKLFEGGARAVSLRDDRRIGELWNRVVHNNPPELSGSSGWKEFLNKSLFTFVRNHQRYKTDYGDLIWFEPESYGYIARKVVTYPDPQTGRMCVCPENLQNDNGQPAALSQDTLRLAWDTGIDILRSAWRDNDFDPARFVVHVEMLKYPNSLDELERIFNFINVGSTWKRIGMKLDLRRIRARGPFAKRFVRDLYAWSTMVPLLGKCALKINEYFANTPFYRLDSDYTPVGQAHVDGSRFLTILASDRDVLKTEAFGDGRWEEMPMSADSFIIFPGTFYDPTNKIKPTMHRYSIQKVRNEPVGKCLNLTFVLGISTREMFEKRRPT